MHLEMELKFRVADVASVACMLQAMEADFQGGGFEENWVFDTPGRELFLSGVLLRLRRAGRAVLTLKKRPSGNAVVQGVKVFEETETEVADFEAMAGVLEGLGYMPSFRYEKIRGEYRVGDAMVCLDILPFGHFVEIEGSREDIMSVAERLGLDPGDGITASYHRLNQDHRRDRGLPPLDGFVFSDRELALAQAKERYPDSGSI